MREGGSPPVLRRDHGKGTACGQQVIDSLPPPAIPDDNLRGYSNLNATNGQSANGRMYVDLSLGVIRDEDFAISMLPDVRDKHLDALRNPRHSCDRGY